MSISRILGILTLLATGLTTVAGLLDSINPKYALLVAGIGAAITAFTERVQGGLSKTEGEADGRNSF